MSSSHTTQSRLLTVDQAAGAERLVWGGPNGGSAPPIPPSTMGIHGSTSAQENREAVDHEHLKVLMEQQAHIHDLERQLVSRPREAFQQGYNEGQAAGTAQANAKVDPMLAKLAQSIQDLVAVRKQHLIESEEDAVKLSVAVARRILHRELSVDPDSILGVVRAAFERVDSRDVNRIRLNPEDVPALQRHLAALNLPPRVELTADPSLERGGVVVETSRGSLDASVSAQLNEIERGLVDLVRRGS